MTKFIVPTLALILAAAPAFAEQPVPTTFTRDGVTYEYVVTEKNGQKHIEGEVVSTGEHFSLRVVKGRVYGDFSGAAVSFAVSDARSQPTIASR